MFPEKTAIRTHSVEETRFVLSFYEEEGYCHDSMETNSDFINYPVLILDDCVDEDSCREITGCKEVYYLITNGTLTMIDFDEWYLTIRGEDFEPASDTDVFDFLAS